MRGGTIPHPVERAAGADDRTRRSPLRDPWAAVSLAGAFVYAALTIDRGWIPHDEGTIAQAAVRVLTGELPHRDFTDMYTGGLSRLNVVAFTLFGIDLLAPRILLLLAFAAFLVLLHALARRFGAGPAAAAVVALTAVWSVPNYPAAMPTWYNLFLAVVALWSLLRFLDDPRRVWLFAAGLACGASICIKVVGLYTLAALLLGAVLIEADTRNGDRGDARSAAYAGTVIACLSLYVLLVLLLLRARLDPPTTVHFLVPSVAVAGAAAWRVRRWAGVGSSGERALRLLQLTWPVLAGTALPVALLLVPYVRSGSLGDLLAGTMVLPRRLEFAAASPLPLGLALPALVPLALAGAAGLRAGAIRRTALGLLGASLAAVLALAARDAVYVRSWSALLLTPVLATLIAMGASLSAWAREDVGARSLAALGDAEARPLDSALVGARRRTLDAALAGTVLGTFVLVQYPFSGPIYFFYVAPLVALTALAARSLCGPAWRAPVGVLGAFAFAFGATWIATGDLFAMAQGRYEPRPPHERLALERGGIRVPAAEKEEYEAVVGMMQRLADGSGTTFVTPDAPELYFLSGLRNPTPTFFDFFEDPVGRTERTLATLEREDVRVVVLNRAPQVSGLPPADLVAALERRFPRAASVGRFVVRWR